MVGQSEFAQRATLGGRGSSRVDPLYTVDPVKGMRDVIADLGTTAEATVSARDAETVVVMAGHVATEGEDLETMDLSNRQNEMISALAVANDRTVVVLKDSSPVVLPWVDEVHAVLEAWNQGSEDGHVVADLLLGAVTPSGKLPTTYPRTADDTLAAGRPDRYPGVDEGDGYPVMHYSEGLRMGYRWYQAEGIAPRFPFGFGLSYTSFRLGEVSLSAGDRPGVDPVSVQVRVTNTGEYPGAEVVQVYVEFPESTGQPPRALNQPPRRLVGFRKVHLEPGQSADVELVIDAAASNHPLSVWSDAEHAFVVPEGTIRVRVGTSSEDTQLAGRVVVSR